MAKKQLRVEVRGYVLKWKNGVRGECDCDVYKDDKLVGEWAFPRMSSLSNTARIFSEQAAMNTERDVDHLPKSKGSTDADA